MLLAVVLILATPPAAFATSSVKCVALLGGGTPAHDNATTSFTAYLAQLLQENVIDDDALERVLNSLDNGNTAQGGLVEDIIPEQAALEHSDAAIQREGLATLLASRQVDFAGLREWLQLTLRDRMKTKTSREEAREESQFPFKRIKFNSIEPGAFLMAEQREENRVQRLTLTKPVVLTKPVAMMSHLFTQWQWAKVMKSEKFAMQPENPAIATYDDVVKRLIPRLNQLSKSDDPVLYEIIEDHKRGDRYRLPTEAEWEYIATNKGKIKSRYYFGDDMSLLGKYAWYSENSNHAAHPVGELLPLVVDGMEFFDILGNASEWVSDRFSRNPLGGTDPKGPPTGKWYVIRGGSDYTGYPLFQSIFQRGPLAKGKLAGIRLVRERKR